MTGAGPGARPVAGADAFQRMAAELDYPMFVVTVATPSERSGCLVGFTTQCSIRPPRFIVCLSKRNRTAKVAEGADVLGVHRMTVADEDVARLFGEETGDEIDKFSRCAWKDGPEGVPVLEGVRAWVAVRVIDRIDAGDHVAFVGEPFAGEWRPPESAAERRQLGFQGAKPMDPGHEA